MITIPIIASTNSNPNIDDSLQRHSIEVTYESTVRRMDRAGRVGMPPDPSPSHAPLIRRAYAAQGP
jgi:hypothetical protein